MVDLPGLVELLVDRGDLHRQHEPGGGSFAPAGGRELLFDESFEIGPQAKQARLRRHELLPDLGPPGGVGEVPGADDRDALLAGPEGEVLKIAVPARRPRVLGVDVQIRVVGHSCSSRPLAASSGRRSAPGPPLGPDRTTTTAVLRHRHAGMDCFIRPADEQFPRRAALGRLPASRPSPPRSRIRLARPLFPRALGCHGPIGSSICSMRSSPGNRCPRVRGRARGWRPVRCPIGAVA